MSTDFEARVSQSRWARRVVRRAALVVSVIVAVAFSLAYAGVAYSGTPFEWISGIYVYGASGTSGFGARDYIQITRPSGGYCVDVFYQHTDNSFYYSSTTCTGTVFKWNTSSGYARSWCGITDGSELSLTCETT